ncbi:hypothetical protein [Enterobacter ludwigii]|uniref:hypothetical protein n=1 Tax=Enterobacter ludwigii TaxID=299767 RepID=UPI003075F28E
MASMTDNLYAVAQGNANGQTVYVAVGDNGTILMSRDPKSSDSWALVNSGTTENLRGVIFNENHRQFYAVGDNGALAISTDGKYWTASTLKDSAGNSSNLKAIAYNKKWLFAHGHADKENTVNTINFASQDGRSWSALTQDQDAATAGFAVVANAALSGRFVMTENEPADYPTVKMSFSDSDDPTDGKYNILNNTGTNSEGTVPLADDEFLYGLATDEKGRYVAVGDNGQIVMATDSDLLDWNKVNIAQIGKPKTLRAVAMLGDSFIAVGDEGALSVTNDGGLYWKTTTDGTTNLRGVVAINQASSGGSHTFIVVGDKGRIFTIGS